jgi:hypothetical protein
MHPSPNAALPLCAAILLMSCGLAAQPRVRSYDPSAVVRAKEAYLSDSPNLKPAQDKLRKDAEAALREPLRSVMDKSKVASSGDKHDYLSLARYFWPDSSKPDGLPYVNRDGEPNLEILTITDATHFASMVENVHTLSLAYYVFGEERFADRAAQAIRTWFLEPSTRMNPHLQHAQMVTGMDDGRPAGTIETRNIGLVCDATALIAGSRAWTTSAQDSLLEWFRSYHQWLTTAPRAIAASNFENNIAIWFAVQAGSLALFVGDTTSAAKILLKARSLAIDIQIQPDGSQPEELRRTTSAHYVLFNLEAFFRLAWLSSHAGVDVWSYRSPDGRSLRAALDWVMPYLRREKDWTWKQIKPFSWDTAYFPILQQASSVYGDRGYAELARRLAGAKRSADRSHLLYRTNF